MSAGKAPEPCSVILNPAQRLRLLNDARLWLAVALVAAAVAVTFRPCLKSSFDGLPADSAALALDARGSRGPAFTTFVGGRYQPLAQVSLALHGSVASHVLGLILHAVTSVLVYVLGLMLLVSADSRISPRPSAPAHVSAWLAALLFALHPLRAESLVWTTEQGILLSGFFAALTVVLYIQATKTAGRGVWFVLSVLSYGLSLLAGPAGVALPLVLVALDWYPLRRLGSDRAGCGAAVRGVWLEKVPFLLLGSAATVIGLCAQSLAPPAFAAPGSGSLHRLGAGVYGCGFYLWKTVWPFGLLPIYEPQLPLDWLNLKYIGSAGCLVAGIALLAALGRRQPAITVAAVSYLGLVATSAVLLLGGAEEVADRYSYLPSMVIVLLIGGGLYRLWTAPDTQLRWLAGGLTLVGLAAAGVLAVQARQQCALWQTPQKLWTSVVENVPLDEPRSGVAYYLLGRERERELEPERAAQLYRAALGARPTLVEAQRELGEVLLGLGRYDEAVQALRRAVALAPGRAALHWRFGCALAAHGELQPAEAQLREAIDLAPEAIAFRNSLGHLLMITGRWDDAAEVFRGAVQIDPRDADLEYDLGRACAQGGHAAPAAEAYRRALALNPHHGLARRALEQLVPGSAP